MGDVALETYGVSGAEYLFLISMGYFHLSGDDVGTLLMGMMMKRGGMALLHIKTAYKEIVCPRKNVAGAIGSKFMDFRFGIVKKHVSYLLDENLFYASISYFVLCLV